MPGWCSIIFVLVLFLSYLKERNKKKSQKNPWKKFYNEKKVKHFSLFWLTFSHTFISQVIYIKLKLNNFGKKSCHFNRRMISHKWQFESWEDESNWVKTSRNVWPKAPNVQILFLFFLLFGFFEPKIDQKTQVKILLFCAKIWIWDSIYLFLHFSLFE
jgi:hypothetical protein